MDIFRIKSPGWKRTRVKLRWWRLCFWISCFSSSILNRHVTKLYIFYRCIHPTFHRCRSPVNPVGRKSADSYVLYSVSAVLEPDRNRGSHVFHGVVHNDYVFKRTFERRLGTRLQDYPRQHIVPVGRPVRLPARSEEKTILDYSM